MKQYTNTTLGLTAIINVPDSAEEFDRLAGRTGACVDEANRNVIYRGVNPKLRDGLVEKIEAETGEERAYKEDDDGNKTYTETEKTFYNRVIGSGKLTEEQAQVMMNEVAKTVEFDPSPTRRAKKVPKEITNAVANIISAIDNGQTSEDVVKQKIAAALEIEDFEASFGEFDEDSLARALVADAEKQERERQQKFL